MILSHNLWDVLGGGRRCEVRVVRPVATGTVHQLAGVYVGVAGFSSVRVNQPLPRRSCHFHAVNPHHRVVVGNRGPMELLGDNGNIPCDVVPPRERRSALVMADVCRNSELIATALVPAFGAAEAVALVRGRRLWGLTTAKKPTIVHTHSNEAPGIQGQESNSRVGETRPTVPHGDWTPESAYPSPTLLEHECASQSIRNQSG